MVHKPAEGVETQTGFTTEGKTGFDPVQRRSVCEAFVDKEICTDDTGGDGYAAIWSPPRGHVHLKHGSL